MARKTIKERFWEKVNIGDEDECWEWTACTTPWGYGRFRLKEGVRLAHRFAWELTFAPPNELCVLHKCDNPPCVNPRHLWLGSIAENNQDMWRKGRGGFFTFRGEEHYKAKLTANQVLEIRRLYQVTKISQRKLGKLFGISQSQTWHIIHRKSWKHLP